MLKRMIHPFTDASESIVVFSSVTTVSGTFVKWNVTSARLQIKIKDWVPCGDGVNGRSLAGSRHIQIKITRKWGQFGANY